MYIFLPLTTFTQSAPCIPTYRSTDGNKDNVLEHGSCSFPQAQQGQRSWWRVDLLAAHTITRVIIHNRSLERRRLINTTVYVSLEATFNFDDRYICGTVQGYVNAMLMVSVDCQGPMAARYVTLIDDDVGEPMNFCEVEVIGEYHSLIVMEMLNDCSN